MLGRKDQNQPATFKVADPNGALREITVTLEVITPELAQEYLGLNVRNRNLKRTKIAKYVRDLLGGTWMFTAEAIKFNDRGELADGQNRLMAIIQAEIAAPTLVARGLHPDAQDVMDSGAARSGSDALFIDGVKDSKAVQAAANCYHAWDTGVYTKANQKASSILTNAEIVQVVRENPSLVEAVRLIGPVYKRTRLPKGALASSYVILSGIDAEDAHEFFSRIQNLDLRGIGDPLATLIQRVTADREQSRTTTPATGLYYIFRTWNALRAGEDLHRLQVGSAIGGWTEIPEPK